MNNLVLAVRFVCDFIGNLSYRFIYCSFVYIFVNLRLITSTKLVMCCVKHIIYNFLFILDGEDSSGDEKGSASIQKSKQPDKNPLLKKSSL